MKINRILKKTVEAIPILEKPNNDEGSKNILSSFKLAVHIKNNCENNIVFQGGNIFIYHEGSYHKIDSIDKTKDFIKQCLKKITGHKDIEARTIEETLKEVSTDYHEFIPYIKEDITYVNMKTKVLAIKKDGTIEELPHEKKYNFLYKLEYDYEPNAKAEVFEKFLLSSLGDQELSNIIFEYLAYTLIKDTKNFEKALFLYGSGSNGKSTLLNIIKEVYGKSNISYVELANMGDKLECALMEGKLLNISSDAKKNGLDTSSFKKIVSGEPVLGKKLYKDIYNILNFPKLIIAMNKLPYNNGDNTHGFFRRLLIIPFSKIINEKDKDYDLENKVIKNELSGVFNLIIKGLIRLHKQGKFSESNISNEITAQYIESTNHIPIFLEENCYERVKEGSKEGTPLKDIYADFKAWCSLYGHNPYSSNNLSSELEQLGYISYKNSIKYYRILKKKLHQETGFSPFCK